VTSETGTKQGGKKGKKGEGGGGAAHSPTVVPALRRETYKGEEARGGGEKEK